MAQERQITMISGNILPAKNKSTLSKEELAGISNVFSSSVDKYKVSQDIVDSGNHSEKRGRIAGKHNPDIHEHWETIKTSEKLQMNNLNDSKTIIPSRCESETSDGGRGHLRGSIASIFNPTAIEDVRNSEYTDHAIQAGKDRKNKMAEKASNDREWEIISAAKSTSNTHASQLGFAPLKSAFSQAPIPEVRISEVEKMKSDNKENANIAKEALKIRQESNQASKVADTNKLADNRKWEDVVLDSITKQQERNITVVESNIKMSNGFVKEPDKKPNVALAGLFTMPENPKDDGNEKSIKRDSSNLRQDRTKREDDRSWETLNNAKSKSY